MHYRPAQETCRNPLHQERSPLNLVTCRNPLHQARSLLNLVDTLLQAQDNRRNFMITDEYTSVFFADTPFRFHFLVHMCIKVLETLQSTPRIILKGKRPWWPAMLDLTQVMQHHRALLALLLPAVGACLQTMSQRMQCRPSLMLPSTVASRGQQMPQRSALNANSICGVQPSQTRSMLQRILCVRRVNLWTRICKRDRRKQKCAVCATRTFREMVIRTLSGAKVHPASASYVRLYARQKQKT